MPNIHQDPRIIPYEENFRPPTSYVPVYPIKVAAGKFAHKEDRSLVDEPPLGWVDANLKSTSQDYFAAFIYGPLCNHQSLMGLFACFANTPGALAKVRFF